MKREAGANARALARETKRLMEIEQSIVKLGDEDLLDLADIFAEMRDTPIAEFAFAEMSRRELRL
jgi:hypothetical protein